jgi:predicted peptidase
MKFNVPSLISTLLLTANLAHAADLPVPGVQQEKHFNGQNYLFFLPQDYGTSAKRWPLLLFFHGKGELGTNLAVLKKHGPPKLAESNPRFPFILVSPQTPKWGWDNNVLNALLDDIISKYRVDTNQIYLTGLSMGGSGVWSLAEAHPERFAAIVPVCAAGEPKNPATLAAMPMWIFHGAKDPTVPVQRSRKTVASMKAAGANVKYTEYPQAGHDCWTQTYNNPQLFQWLLQQNLQSRPAR